MPLYENFPYTNFHELNLDWLVDRVRALEAAFPEGTVGIVKGGTGATTAEGARENLGIIAPNIPIAEGSTSTLDQELARLEDNINSFSADIKYRIFRLVSDLGLTSGTATLASCWAAMSTGDILIAPPSEFAPGQIPENSGSVVMVRNAGTSGSLRFYGNRTYEQEFQNNYPTGTWHTILNDTDVIPVNKGGTGATTAEAARQNLGITFDGVVVSVAGIPAEESTGNVPLTASDLDVKMKLYTTITDPDIGLPTGSTVTAVWNALPANSRVVFPRSEVSNPPEDAAGVIDIAKTGPNSNLGWIIYHAQQQSTGDYQMYLTSAGVPSGTWTRTGTQERTLTDFGWSCTFPKGDPVGMTGLTDGNMVIITYQGPQASYAGDDVLVRIPAEYQTDHAYRVVCSLNNTSVGTVYLPANSRDIKIAFAPSGTGRVYFQLVYFLP